MAETKGDRFWATTKINFGKRTEDGSQDGKYEKTVFNVNDEVKGLAPEDMKGLWRAGALTKEEPEKASSDEDEEEKVEEQEAAKTPAPPAKATPAKVAANKQP